MMKRFVLIFLLAAVLSPLNLYSQEEQKNRKHKLEEEISRIESLLKQNSSKNSDALYSLSLTRKKIAARKKLIAESDKEIKRLNDSIYLRQKEANRLKERLDTMTFYYSKLVRNAYKNRDSRLWYIYLLSSSDIPQMARRFSYLRSLSKTMNAQAERIKDARAQLESELAMLEFLRADARKVKKQREEDLASLAAEEARDQALVKKLGKEKTKYTKQLNAKKKQVEALNKEIEKMVRAAVKGTPGKKKKIDYTLAAEFAANKGKLPWPAEGTVVEKFGRHNHPVYTKLVMPFNNGINIAVQKNAPVKAVFNGTVTKIIVMPGYNKCVLVEHGDYFTFYCKLGSVSVKAGDKVATGQTIGTVDTIENKNQLHFQIWQGTKPQNPEFWLREE